jgi:DNA-binding response OmpR family regulator
MEADIARILIIDDDVEMRHMISRVLRNAHHEPVETTNGVEGLRSFQNEPTSIVITDIVMPHRDGIETICEMRATGLKVGIIAISGGGVRDGALYLSLSKELGADVILQKPFRAADLVAAVDGLLQTNDTN